MAYTFSNSLVHTMDVRVRVQYVRLSDVCIGSTNCPRLLLGGTRVQGEPNVQLERKALLMFAGQVNADATTMGQSIV